MHAQAELTGIPVPVIPSWRGLEVGSEPEGEVSLPQGWSRSTRGSGTGQGPAHCWPLA